MATKTTKIPDIDTDKLSVGGPAFEKLLGAINLKKQFDDIKEEIPRTKSPSKKDDLIKKLKLKPSPLFAKILSQVQEAQALAKIASKEEALVLARKIGKI